MSKRRFSIRVKLFFSLMMVGLLAVTLVGFQTYYSAGQIILADQELRLTAVRNYKKEQVEYAIRNIIERVTYFSSNTESIKFINELSKSFKNIDSEIPQLYNICDTKLTDFYTNTFIPQTSNAQYTSMSPGEYIPQNRSGTLAQCIYLLQNDEDFKKSFTNKVSYMAFHDKYFSTFKGFYDRNQLRDLILIDRDGNVVFSIAKNPDFGTNVLNDKWMANSLAQVFNKTKQTPESYKTQVFDFMFYHAAGYEPLAFISAPMYMDGEFYGIFVAVVKNSTLDTALSSKTGEYGDLGKYGESYLVGEDLFMRSKSRFLTDDKKAYIEKLQNLNYNTHLINMIKAKSTSILLQKNTSPVVQRIFDGKSGVAKGFNYLGEETFIAYTPINLPQLNFGLVVEMPAVDIYAPTMTLKYDIFKSAFIVFFIIIVLTYILSSAIISPIIFLMKAVGRFTQGDTYVTINDQSSDEIGKLSRAIDQMVTTINLNHNKITETNNRLTSEIMERANIENSLQQERDFISAIFDSQSLMFVISDLNGVIVRTNKTLEDIAGYTKEELLGKKQFHYTTKTVEGEEVHPIIKRIIDTKATESFNVEHKTKYNQLVTVKWMVSPMIKQSAGIDFLIWAGLDITKQLNTEELLRDNEMMLLSLAKNAQDAIIITDEKDNVFMWNEAAERMFGRAFNEMQNKSMISTIIPPEFESEIIRSIDNLFENESQNKGITLEVEAKHKNGTQFPIELSMSLVEVREQWNTLYIIRDNTLRKQKEEEIKHALENAKIAEKAKSEFLANMSHEIRTPLNGIIGFMELLQHTTMTSSQKEYVDIVNFSANSLLGIINEILDFSKIESGKMQLENISFEPLVEFEHTVELYVPKANEKNIDLVTELDKELPYKIIGDPLRLRQVLSNLLSNAIKFTPENGTVKLKVTVEKKTADSCTLNIAIQDTGIGISPEKQANIFEAFSQADNSVTRKYGGTGLGLAISSSFVKLMNSQLKLNSEPGKGSTFWFTASFHIDEDKANRKGFEGLRIGVYRNPDKISVYEKSIIEYLNALDCEVVTYTGIGDFKRTDNIDILFMDNVTVDEKTAEEIKKLLPGSSRIIVTSDNSDNVISGSMNYRLTKPVNISKVVNILNEIVYGKQENRKNLINNNTDSKYKGHILVAEDNSVNQQLIRILLEKLGLTLDIASNGHTAYDMFTTKKYDLVLMDIHMPLLDGISATKKIIAWEKENYKEHTPIVALTANVIQDDQLSYFEAGMNDFIAKPIIPEELDKVLNKFLRMATKEQESEGLESLAKHIGINDINLLKHIIGEFVSNTEHQIVKLYEALEKKDYKAMKDISVNILGAASNLRFKQIETLLLQLDNSYKKEDNINCLPIIDSLARAVQNIKLMI